MVRPGSVDAVGACVDHRERAWTAPDLNAFDDGGGLQQVGLVHEVDAAILGKRAQRRLRGRSLEEVVARTDGAFTFRVPAEATGTHDLELIPYHRITHERYDLYWQLA